MERRHAAEGSPYAASPAGAGTALTLPSATEERSSAQAATPTIVIQPRGDHVYVGMVETHYTSSTNPALGPLDLSVAAVKAAPGSFVDYYRDVGDAASGRDAGGNAELQATVRVVTVNPSGTGSMNPLAERLAELTRHYPLATTFDWKKMQDVLGPARIFAIESEPVTFDVDQRVEAFTGRARVLADVLDPADSETFLESRVLDARVRGRIEDGVASIATFEFQDAR